MGRKRTKTAVAKPVSETSPAEGGEEPEVNPTTNKEEKERNGVSQEEKIENKEDTGEEKSESKEDTGEEKSESKEDTVEDKRETKEDTVEEKGESKKDTVEEKKMRKKPVKKTVPDWASLSESAMKSLPKSQMARPKVQDSIIAAISACKDSKGTKLDQMAILVRNLYSKVWRLPDLSGAS